VSSQDQDSSFVNDVLPAFISEAREQTDTIEQLLLQLEGAPQDRELLDELFRCAHTVKGSAGIFGLTEVVSFTHHVETLLDRLREGDLLLDPVLSTLLLQSNDEIRALVSAAEDASQETAERQQARASLVLGLQTACGASDAMVPAEAPVPEAAVSRTPGAWQIRVAFGVDTFRNGMDPLAILNYLRGIGSIHDLSCDLDAVPALDSLDPESCHLSFRFGLQTEASRAEIESAFSFVREDCTLDIESPVQAQELSLPGLTGTVKTGGATSADVAPMTRAASTPAPRAQPAHERRADDQRLIRVQADRLDAVINLLGELVIAGAGASLLARETRQGSLIEANLQITRLIEEIRNGTLQLRMVPIGETFSRFRRVVRDTASELGKDVALDIVGGETELDKSVVERIADPLMHLVRNALDHGLEAPAQRLVAGKPPQGRLTLSACHESGSILIRIQDDGRGIQRERVLQRAWDRGLVESGVVPPDADILKLIFEAGFSTAEKVTNLSGRGVGMDVVRSNIEALRGSVNISSEEGRGSCIEIRLPLTLAIIDGFLIGVGPSKFIFPLEAVVEVIESRPTQTVVDARGSGMVELRGQVLPVLSLRTLYSLESPVPERSSVVVIQAGTRRYGVLVDQLLGQHQTVIKPLGRMFRSLRGMSGSSILGSGEVALIFDVNSLGQLAAQQPSLHSSATRQTADAGLSNQHSPKGQTS
jgi:two-component system chemotaxis sensor kinase CheA